MGLRNVHRAMRFHATKLRKHPAFHPCQGITQLGIMAMNIERSSWAELCLMGGAVTMIVIALLAEIESDMPEFD